MKLSINYKNKNIELILTNLCSYGDHGDYELFPTEPLDFRLKCMENKIKTEGCRLKVVSNRMILFNFNDAEITLYKSGRMILENIRPDEYQVAMDIGQRIILMTAGK